MILSFMLQSHSSSGEIQLGDGPARGGKKKKSVFLSLCVFGDNSWLISPFKWPCGAQSVNKQRPAKLIHSFLLQSLILKSLFSPLFPLTHYTSSRTLCRLPPSSCSLSRRYKCESKVQQTPKLKWVYNNRFSCCHRSLDPSLFNLWNILLAWSPVKKRL